MDLDEFQDYLDSKLVYFQGVDKFKSIKRAMRRGHVTSKGIIAPRRPYNNRGNTSPRKGVDSRKVNAEKRKIYDQLKERL